MLPAEQVTPNLLPTTIAKEATTTMNFQGTTSSKSMLYPDERLGDRNSSPAEDPPQMLWSQQHHPCQKPPPSQSYQRHFHNDDASVCVSVSSWAALDPLYSPPRPSYASPPTTRGGQGGRPMPVMPRNEGPLLRDDVSISTLNSWAGIDTDQPTGSSPPKSRMATSDSAIRYGSLPQGRTNLRIPRPRAECEAPPPPVPLPRRSSRDKITTSSSSAQQKCVPSESSWANAEVNVKSLAVSLAKDALMPAAHIPMVRRKSYVSCSTKSSGTSTKRRSNTTSTAPRGMDTMKVPPLPVPRGKLSSWITGRSSKHNVRPPQPHVDP